MFMGYVMIGTESAVVIRLTDGRTRMIPVTGIAHIDVIGTAERKEEKKQAYYG
jgi:ribosomal protein L2